MVLDGRPSARVLGVLRRRRVWRAVAGVAVVTGGALVIGNLASQWCGMSGPAIGCGEASLKPAAGYSVVMGYGHLTGNMRTVYGKPEHEIEVERVQVLAGASRPATVIGWLATVPQPVPGTAAAQVPGLLAPDGHVLATLSPDTSAVQETSTLLVRPVVGSNVIFSAASCGSAPAGLKTAAFNGPLVEVPGSRSYTVAKCYGGFHSSPLEQVRRLLG